MSPWLLNLPIQDNFVRNARGRGLYLKWLSKATHKSRLQKNAHLVTGWDERSKNGGHPLCEVQSCRSFDAKLTIRGKLSGWDSHTLRKTHRRPPNARRNPSKIFFFFLNKTKKSFEGVGSDSCATRGKQLHGGGRRDWEEVRSLRRNRYEVGFFFCCKRKKKRFAG